MRYSTEQREIITRAILKRKRDEFDKDTARKLIAKYNTAFQGFNSAILRTYINTLAHKLGRANYVKSLGKGKYETTIKKLAKKYPEDTHISIANKLLVSFPEMSLSHARAMVSQVRKFNKIL